MLGHLQLDSHFERSDESAVAWNHENLCCTYRAQWMQIPRAKKRPLE
jgi:hypothetical protein